MDQLDGKFGSHSEHLRVVCDFCGHENELTFTAVRPEQRINCSTCGGHLGTVGELISSVVSPADVIATRPGTFGS